MQALSGDGVRIEQAIRFLADRVRRDPGDFNAQNKLARYYLRRARETSSPAYLALATSAARASLAVVPESANVAALAVLAEAHLSEHAFLAARDIALRLIKLEPTRAYVYGILGDALLELGDYQKAGVAIDHMSMLGGRSLDSEVRHGRLAFLRGDSSGALRHYVSAIELAFALGTPPREPVAWCYWQLGEVAFASGDYAGAERHYRDALITFADYHRALAGMGRVYAAHSEFAAAAEYYRRAIKQLADPAYAAALGDIYRLGGRSREAAAQYQIVEAIGRLAKAGGGMYNRPLALFYADHDLSADAAYANAGSEYQVRRDVYGADALAWTALKAGKLDQAQTAIKEALRLGTPEAKFLYHAGMIARAGGDSRAARDYLSRALRLSPYFDSLQASIARRALQELSGIP